jgi:hypothetical protein
MPCEIMALTVGTQLGSHEMMAQGDVFSLQCSLATKAKEKGTERH